MATTKKPAAKKAPATKKPKPTADEAAAAKAAKAAKAAEAKAAKAAAKPAATPVAAVAASADAPAGGDHAPIKSVAEGKSPKAPKDIDQGVFDAALKAVNEARANGHSVGANWDLFFAQHPDIAQAVADASRN